MENYLPSVGLLICALVLMVLALRYWFRPRHRYEDPNWSDHGPQQQRVYYQGGYNHPPNQHYNRYRQQESDSGVVMVALVFLVAGFFLYLFVNEGKLNFNGEKTTASAGSQNQNGPLHDPPELPDDSGLSNEDPDDYGEYDPEPYQEGLPPWSKEEDVVHDPNPAPEEPVLTEKAPLVLETSLPLSGNYYVQIAALAELEGALKKKSRWKGVNEAKVVVLKNQADKLYRVLVGPYTSPELAKQAHAAKDWQIHELLPGNYWEHE